MQEKVISWSFDQKTYCSDCAQKIFGKEALDLIEFLSDINGRLDTFLGESVQKKNQVLRLFNLKIKPFTNWQAAGDDTSGLICHFCREDI